MNLSLSEDKDADPCAASSNSINASTNITAAFSDKVSDAVGISHAKKVLVHSCIDITDP